MSETVKRCLLCGSSRQRIFDRREFKGIPVINHICLSCGLVYLSPRMTGEELREFYEREYRQMYQGEEGPTHKDTVVQTQRAELLLSFLAGELDPPSRVLDMGCSTGILLESMRDRFGCAAVGVEPGEAYRQYAQEKGLAVYADLSELPARDERFQLISMGHVLEHLPDPVGFLKQLRREHLSPGGRLLIEVPNLYFHDSFEVAHMTSFSPHTLRETLRQAGFEVVKQKTHGEPVSGLIPLYITVLARAAAGDQRISSVRPERGARFKRRLGMLYRAIIQRVFPHRAWRTAGEEEA